MTWLKLRSRLTITVAIAVFFALLFFSALTATAITEGLTEDVIFSTEDGLDLAEDEANAALSDYIAELQRGVVPGRPSDTGRQQEVDRLVRGRDDLDDDVELVILLNLEGEEIDPADLIGNEVTARLDGRINRMVCKNRLGGASCNIETNGIDSATGNRLEAIVTRIADENPGNRGRVVVAELLFVNDEPAAVALVARHRSDDTATDVPPVAYVVIAGVLTAILTGITWFTLRRAMRPVELIIDRVAGIEADSLDQRVPVPKAKDELHRLANTMNRMLDRLERSRDGQRRFISDASHELRSPITATQATLEVARANPDDTDWDTVAEVLTEENDRLANLVDDLLVLARLDEQPGTDAGVPIDVDELCLTEAARPHPVPVSVRIEQPARVIGRLSLLTRALRNLVDNAASHASSAVEIVVDVEHRPHGPAAVVRVIDDGPGVNPAESELIFERFARVDSARSRPEGRGGAGLGLAIVREVAIIHGGTCVVDPTASDGACFVLTLPVQPTTMPPSDEPPVPPPRPTTDLERTR